MIRINLLRDCRSRKRNAKKNRSNHAKTSHMRNRPVSGADFEDLKKGKFDWFRRDN